VGYGGLNFTLADGRLKNRLAYGYTSTDSNFYDPTQAVTPLTFQAVGRNHRWEYQGVLVLPGEAEATFGLESERSTSRSAFPSSFDPSPVPDRARTGIDSLYVQVLGQVAAGLTLTVGGRHDRHQTFGDHNLGQVAAAWKLNDGATVLRASFAQGFKAPSLYQLYSPYGNTGLAPEASDSWDAGIEQRLGQVTVSLTGFARSTSDQIDFVSCTFGSLVPLCRPNGIGRFGYYDNIARTKAHGLELTANTTLGGVALGANYTWTRAENDISGKRLPRRPEHTANGQASYVWGSGFTTGLGVHYVGESFDNGSNTRRLKSYVLTDLRASWPLRDGLEIYGRVENAFDKAYETTANYGSTGRGAYIGLRSRF
jgi:vitamin B12 transporter